LFTGFSNDSSAVLYAHLETRINDVNFVLIKSPVAEPESSPPQLHTILN